MSVHKLIFTLTPKKCCQHFQIDFLHCQKLVRTNQAKMYQISFPGPHHLVHLYRGPQEKTNNCISSSNTKYTLICNRNRPSPTEEANVNSASFSLGGTTNQHQGK